MAPNEHPAPSDAQVVPLEPPVPGAIKVGEFFGHFLWQVGMTDDAHRIEKCARCGYTFIGAINDWCEGERC